MKNGFLESVHIKNKKFSDTCSFSSPFTLGDSNEYKNIGSYKK